MDQIQAAVLFHPARVTVDDIKGMNVNLFMTRFKF